MSSATSHRRTSTAVALGLALLALMSAVLWARLGHVSEHVGGQAQRVARARVLELGPVHPGQAPGLAEAAPWIDLPDNWDTRRPGYTGYVGYHMALPPGLAQRERPAIYLPAAGMNAEVWLNGQRAGGLGRMQMPPSRHFYTPQLVELSPGLFRTDGQADQLWVVVVGHANYRSGLAPVWVGSHAELYPAWRWRGFWQNDGSGITSVINLAIAVFVLAIGWRDREHSAYLWFGAAAAVWALRNLIYVVVEPVIPDLLFAELCVAGAMWFIGLFAIFALRFSQAHQPGYRGPPYFVAVTLVYAIGTTAYFVAADTYTKANAAFAPMAAVGIVLTLWSGWRLVRLATLKPRADLLAVAAGAVIYLVLLINDYSIAIDRTSLGEVYIRQYATLPLFIAITATLARRYLVALRTAHELAASLQGQVDEQRRQLQVSFERLREAEREQARAEERGRLMGDLHDGLGLHLATALRQARTASDAREPLVNTLQDCMDDLRVAIDSLDEQERDPLALLGSLRFRMAPRFESVGLSLGWEVAPELGELPALDAPGALDLLRIVQEALSNTLKHSGATAVQMSLATVADGTRVSVHDNGRGFDPAQAATGRGLGNMKARAMRLRARLRWLHSAQGTTVELLLPREAATTP